MTTGKHLSDLNRLQAIIDSAIDGIITINSQGQISSANPAAIKMFGFSYDEMHGQNINMLMPDPDKSRHDSYIHNYLETSKPKIIGLGREVTGQRKDGSKFPFYLSVSEFNFEGEKTFVGIIHDISELKVSREKLRRYANELERSNRELQDFAYVSSHDLQEPLRKIQAFGDRLLKKESEALSEQGKDYLNRMLNASSRMQTLINDLLTFSRVTTEAKPFQEYDLTNILKDVLSDLEYSIEATGATVEFDPLPTIECDPTQIRQLFQNLISNAIKFTDEKKPKIKITSKNHQLIKHLNATPGDEIIQLFFKDNGIGFEKKHADKIFQIFQRLDGQKFAGSGIGLAICKKIANRHGGTITAESTRGAGSNFIVTLSKKQTKESSTSL